MSLTFNEYQDLASKTAVYPEELAVSYLALGLVSEAGEVAGKVKKIIRDDGGVMFESSRVALIDEISDVVWYASELCRQLSVPFGYVAAKNLAKLSDRQTRGALHGSGDNR